MREAGEAGAVAVLRRAVARKDEYAVEENLPLLRIAAGFRKLLSAHSDATTIYCDAGADDGIYETRPGVHPIAGVIDHVAGCLGRNVHFVKASNPIPTAFALGPRNSLRAIVKIFLGRFRPRWVRARHAFREFRKHHPDRPVFYLFFGRAHDHVAKRLAASTDFHVVCS